MQFFMGKKHDIRLSEIVLVTKSPGSVVVSTRGLTITLTDEADIRGFLVANEEFMRIRNELQRMADKKEHAILTRFSNFSEDI